MMVLVYAVAAAACGARDAAPAADADQGSRWEDARAAGGGTLRVLYVPAEGFAGTGAGGSPEGVTVEIMRSFAQWLADTHGVQAGLEFVEEQDWRTFYGRVRDAHGGVFGLGNVTITDARRAELQFSPPYMNNVAVLITHDTIAALGSLAGAAAAFAGLQPLAFQGTLHEARVTALRDSALPGRPLEYATSNAEILERVASGCCFAFIDGYNFWRAEERGMPLRRHAVADDPAEEFGIIMPLDSDWAPLLEQFLSGPSGFRASAEYREIMERHLGAGVAAALQDPSLRH